jgi:hypothetical protein
MAVYTLSLEGDNVSGAELFAAHNPLFWRLNVASFVGTGLYIVASVVVGSDSYDFRIIDEDFDGADGNFLLDATGIINGLMPDAADIEIGVATAEVATEMFQEMTINFHAYYSGGDTAAASGRYYFVHSARDLKNGYGATMKDWQDFESKTFYSQKLANKCNWYFYADDTDTKYLTFELNGAAYGAANKTVSTTGKGFYKVPTFPFGITGTAQVEVRTGSYAGAIEQTHYIIIEDMCEDDIRIKWLSKEGFYKYGVFSQYLKSNRKIKDGLKVPVYFTEMYDQKANENIITKELQIGLRLRKLQTGTTKLEYYLDLASSPKVYLNIGTQTYLRSPDWLQVNVKWNPNYFVKKNFHDIVIDVYKPKSYIQQL